MNTVDNKEKNELIIPVEQTCYNKIMARSRKQRETIKILQWALMILSLLLVFCIWDITSGKSDEEYEAELLQLVEQNAVLQTRVEELKAQNKELLEKLNRIEAMLNAAENPEAENTEEH